MIHLRPLQRFALGSALITALLSLPAQAAPAQEYYDPLAFKMLDRGTYHLARFRFGKLIGEQPGVPGHHAGLALTYCRMEELAAARGELALARPEGADEPLLAAAQGCLAEAEGDLETALEQWTVAAQTSELMYYPATRLRMLIDHGEIDEAEVALHDLEISGWSSMTAVGTQAECQLSRGDVEGAIHLLTLLEMKRPRLARTLPVATLVALSQERMDPEAAQAFPRIVGWGSAGRASVYRAEAMRRLGLLDAAEVEVNRRRSRDDDPVSVAFVARIEHDLGQGDLAWQRLGEARQRWPMSASVALTEALLLAREGRPEATAALDDARSLGIPPWDAAIEREVAALIEP